MSKKSNRPQFRLKPACAALMLVFAAQQAAANPVGGVVASGQASFAASASTLTVTNTPGTIINWQSFSIAANETTHFAQQSAASTVLNRVATTGNPSSILGTLSSNGRVFLVNPGGIVFGQGATVDVAGLVATTLNLSDADFLAGRYSFARVPGAQSISNAGNITAQSGGEIYLIAPDVKNTGVISAPNGEILLAAGHEVELVNSFDPNLRVSITAPAGDATNVGKLIVESGSLGLFGTVVRNSGTVSADSAVLQGGKIVLRASQRAEAGGTISANGTGGGSVSVSAAHSTEPTMPGVVVQTGSIEANGASGAGGSVSLNGDSILSSAAISVNGAAAGGQISVQAAGRALSTSSARYSANSATGSGGDILVSANVSNYTSGSYSATGATGGRITLAGNEIKLAGAQLDASGTHGGGAVHVGGLMHGAAGFGAQGIALANATSVFANRSARFAADAVQTGNGGEVVLWSDQSMRFSGNISARGGALGGNGGMAEVSGLTSLGYTGLVDLSASRGAKGTLLLDPYNITIAAGNGALPASPYLEILDTTPGAGEGFGGFQNLVLSNGNILITSPNDSLNGSSSGAVYLYTSAGALLNTLLGGTANDRVGNGGITELNSGHYLVYSPNWSGNLGAVTWMDGSTGQLAGGAAGGAVSNTNSLVGGATGDQVGSGGATWLTGLNYAIRSTLWGSGGIAANARGAVTWINGATGELSNSTVTQRVYGGAVGLTNSLVGSAAGDKVGTQTLTYVYYGTPYSSDSSGMTVTGGNLIVSSNNWSNGGAAVGAGAVTWMSGATGALSDGATGGAISGANSLVGSAAGDRVGTMSVSQWYGPQEVSGVTTLSTGNIMVRSGLWGSAGVAANALGAVTWINGATGELSNSTLAVPVYGGAVGSTNSLIGSTAGDRVGSNFMTLANGNVVVTTSNWTQPAGAGPELANVGAVTWISGATGLLAGGSAGGAISSSNSLVGDAANDRVGNGGIYLVGNGNYLVRSGNWNSDRGAVTWVNGAAGVAGAVSSTNSLVGSTAFDYVGTGFTVLSNGNYLVQSTSWDNGAAANAGAVTWGSGAAGVAGVVSSTNSLVGSSANDSVGDGGIIALSNGNYVVRSPYWDNGAVADASAVTWGSGTTGVAGVVSAANSLVGSTANDQAGFGSITALSNGNYLVQNPYWDNGAAADAGAVTWMNGTTGALSNGTFGGAISAANSLVGSVAGDLSGSAVTQLSSGNLLVRSTSWDNVSTLAANAGAVTWMNGATGALSDGTAGGAVSVSNSLIGSTANDMVGSGMIEHYLNLNILLLNPGWDNGSGVNAGAVTWMNSATGELSNSTATLRVYGGAIGAANSLLGSLTSDSLGSGGITQLGNGNFVIASPSWNGGRGAATWMNGATGALSGGGTGGIISALNSLVGVFGYDSVGTGILSFSDYSTYWNYVVRSNWGGGVGALTWVNGTTGLTSDSSGTISATNSLVGSIINDTVGASVANHLSNGNAVFSNQYWSNGRGAVTWMNPANGRLADGLQGGVVSASNSLVGTTPDDIYTAGDNIGSGGITQITDYSTFWNYVVRSPNWTNGAATAAGAVTLGNGATGTVGSVTFANSLVGSVASDRVGSGGITVVSDDSTFWNYIVSSPDWRGAGGYQTGMGAVTWVNGRTGVLSNGLSGDAVDALNSLIGSLAGDQVGVASFSYDSALNGVNVLSNNNLLIRSQHWNGGRSALTWMNGATGRLAGDATGGTVAATNSLLGSAVNDDLGNGFVGVTELQGNGNWVITSPDWGNGGVAANRKGAATWMNGTTGQLADGLFGGIVSASNSLVGSAATPGLLDIFCDCGGSTGVAGGVLALSDGNFVVYRQDFSPDVGALTWGNGGSGTVGTVASNNSLLVFANNVQEMSGQPGSVLVGSGAANGGMGGVYLIGAGAGGASGPLFADSPATDATVGASWIAGTLNLGTNLVLQANNDITQDAGAPITATGLGSLTLQAGRSVTLNDAINIAGALAITANDPGADSLYRDIGPAVLDTTLATLTAGQINLANSGGDILAGTMTASTGAISLVASDNISVAAAQTITAMAAGMGVTLNADSDGLNGGAIRMNDGSSITSNGGNITLGGGVAGDGSGNAAGNATYIDGIYLTGATLDAGGGNIALRGTPPAAARPSRRLMA
ncbi:MAG: cadherin domain-containing protein [Gallionellaceae bacterium]|nr:MAG: cadherin domain-containing protein [Gallionellaceae bacterium]